MMPLPLAAGEGMASLMLIFKSTRDEASGSRGTRALRVAEANVASVPQEAWDHDT